MVDHLTDGANSTSTRTRIDTFLVDTSFVQSTLVGWDAFRSATWWTTNKSWYTRAHSLSVNFSALTVRSARWRVTRILRNFWWYLLATNEGVSLITEQTSARWNVVDYWAFCVLSASSRTWIYALLSYTSFISRTIVVEDTFRSTSNIRISLVLC